MTSVAWLFLLATAPTQSIGRAVLVEGQAELRPAVGDAVPLPPGGALAVGDAVHTDDGRVRLLLNNRSVVDVAPHSDLVLRAAEGEGARSRVTLRAMLGRLWARVAGGDGSERLVLETETAVAGVRGTSLMLETNADLAAFTVDEGEVQIRPVSGEAFSLARRQRAQLRGGAWSIERDLSDGHLAEARAAMTTPRRLGLAVRQRLAGLRGRLGGKRAAAAGDDAKQAPARRGERARGVLRRIWARRGADLDIDPAGARRIRTFLMNLRQEERPR